MKYKCAFCQYQSDDIVSTGQHYESAHTPLIPDGMSGDHFAYYILTGRKEGRCVVCHRPTTWNPKTHKYHRICSDRCKRRYGEIKKLNNPKVQEAMLRHRKISGTYTWSHPVRGNTPQFTYTGSYELDFLKYLDLIQHWDPTDLMMPSPILFEYRYQGQKKFYIPDAYIPSLDLVIEIKDGDPTNPNHHANMHPDIQAINREKERLKRQAVNRTEHHYLIIYNKEYQNFEQYLRTNQAKYLTEDMMDNITAFSQSAMSQFSKQIKKIIMEIIDEWREQVEKNQLEKYCAISTKLNDAIYQTVASDDFDQALLTGKRSIDNDIIKVRKNLMWTKFSYIDTDDAIKRNLGDPYAIYSPQYRTAVRLLKKWEHPERLVFVGDMLDIEKDEDDDTLFLSIAFDDRDDSESDD